MGVGWQWVGGKQLWYLREKGVLEHFTHTILNAFFYFENLKAWGDGLGSEVGQGASTCPPGHIAHSQLILSPGCSFRGASSETVLPRIVHPLLALIN